MIPVFKPCMNKEKILKHLGEIFDSGWIGLGPVTNEFESNVADFIGSKYSVFFNSCTSALHLAIEALKLPKGSIIVVPDITFASTATVALQAGHKLCLAPVTYGDLCIDLEWLETTMNQIKIACVIPVHYSGNCCDMKKLVDLCKSKDVLIIEDCAHAMGTKYNGKSVGTFGEMGCFSYHAVKNLAIGDGGCIVGKDVYEPFLRKMRWMGISKSTYDRTGKQYTFSYDIDDIGYKYHGNDISAVIGLHNLENLTKNNLRRKSIFEKYAAELPCIHVPNDGVESSHHLVSMFINRRNEFIDYMAEKGISIGVHYKPLSSFTVFSQYASDGVKNRSNRIFSTLATLPCFPDLKDTEQDYIIKNVKTFLGK